MPDPRTQNELAEERNLLAGERTLQAWIRTALAMITFGFMITQYFHLESENYFHEIHFPAKWFGFSLVCMGTVLPLVAVIQHLARVSRLSIDDLDGRSIRNLAVVTGLLLSALGLSALVVLIVMVWV